VARSYRALHIIDAVSDWTGKVTSFIMLYIILAMLYGIVRRYILRNPWADAGAMTNSFTVYVILGAAYAFRSGAFVNVDIFQRRFPLRVRAAISAATSVLLFFFCAAILWTATERMVEALPGMQFTLTSFIEPSRWPTRIIVPVGIVLLILQGLAGFVRNVITAVTGDEVS
jgi:TRAP-type mannitol/chloroaromatic compound transport system permease small subunit